MSGSPLASISNLTTTISAISGLLMVSPQKTVGYQPQDLQGNPSADDKPILFHYEGVNEALLDSDITDHYVEDNTAIQDQIGIRPDEIKTQGFISEVTDIPATPALAALALAAQKLTLISAYTPALSQSAILAYNEAAFIYSQVASASAAYVSARSTVNGTGGTTVIGSEGLTSTSQFLPNQTQQQIVYQRFVEYRQNRVLFTIQTPWAIYQNMAIKTLRAIQEADSDTVTDFEVTFKQIRFAEDITATLNSSAQGRAQQQGSPLVNIGTSQPPQAIISQSTLISGMTA